MSPAPHTYLDQKYDETTELGLTWAGAVDVRDAYEWDPEAVIGGAQSETVSPMESLAA